MSSKRLTLAQEGLVWEIAMEHFGFERLLQIVVELWGAFEFPEHVTVDHLCTDTLSCQVLNILKITQDRVRAFVPLREATPGAVTLHSRHASDLADGLIARLGSTCRAFFIRGSTGYGAFNASGARRRSHRGKDGSPQG
ncbi:hypothetical protein AAY86_10425 [Pseudomonas amygdali pv. tabaci str. ATCC 11528]|nr:hypothetical protein C1E_0225910 [Pseudomonas amygdali pv. tabaci str. ATCC 11528]KKY52925.1 hypothetical protein AAY86_10425 [Pseudomonas amygdali pv. tabaci str. ATCC 11528]QED85932.1 hypothetical protein PSYTB_20805 [Pseudomonas amygdali pv. tabaci str. ATCC 11528]TES71353.1 hypothetical protein E2N89_31410 [Pseudomonas syringae pv. tomato]